MAEFKSKFTNGDTLKDRVTGLEGVVTVVAFYATGCTHYALQPRSLKDNGEMKDWTWLDESRLDLVESNSVQFTLKTTGTSGPSDQGPRCGC